ncbi:DUF805 domain-containing protein [Vibrio porteresiae]|uniref:DUF805 domain-containing protein n=1 Tax=Vibrio porteresiae DSM 19223 TaxID=1123496 RepID=A0ABZ0QJ39_9VIBR|nr:DUF805 domain-containing protein [Vibrio porteresiae]WPC76480.1 DUF805 domain-containing protein [Vibrio porteresiae DSM 19223]
MNWYISAIKNGFNFNGRARRKEYWMFGLFHAIALCVFFVLNVITNENSIIAFLSLFYMLAMILPNIAVTIRRFHDIDKSGWNILFSLIPFVGPFIMLYFMVLDSKDYTNQYGMPPKSANESVTTKSASY